MKKLIMVGLLLLSNPLNCCPSCAGLSDEEYTPAFFSDEYYQAYEKTRHKVGKDTSKGDEYESEYIDNTDATIIIDN